MARKPSGIEWLGDVPEHWEVEATGDFRDLLGKRPGQSPAEDELPVRLCITWTFITADEIRRIDLREGDVVITKDRGNGCASTCWVSQSYWQASHPAPLRMASIEQASCSSAVYSRLPPAMPLTSFFMETVAFSMFEAWSVRR